MESIEISIEISLSYKRMKYDGCMFFLLQAKGLNVCFFTFVISSMLYISIKCVMSNQVIFLKKLYITGNLKAIYFLKDAMIYFNLCQYYLRLFFSLCFHFIFSHYV